MVRVWFNKTFSSVGAAIRLIREADVVRVAVELGVDGDGLHAEVPSGPDDPHGDLTTVGDQYLLEHECQCWPDGGRECHIVARIVG